MVQTTDAWRALERELDAWAEADRAATLWWRDDDCIEPGAALDRLLALAEAHGLPLALAVVPARATAALPRRLARAAAEVAVLQHGYSHRNHAPEGRKKQELDPGRPLPAMLEAVQRGAARLDGLFGGLAEVTALPVLVPPWNRIDPRLAPALPALGFLGLSADGPRPATEAAPGLALCNTHVDLLRSQRRGGALSPETVLGDLRDHLEARRSGAADAAEPSGLLTHHLAHDEASWALLEALLPALRRHPAVRFLGAAEAFAPPAAPTPATIRESAA